MTDLLKRPGRIYVTRDVIDENPEVVRDILGQVLIVEARTRFITNDVEYSGYSEHFDEQTDGNHIPVYEIEVSQDGDDMTVEFKKVD